MEEALFDDDEGGNDEGGRSIRSTERGGGESREAISPYDWLQGAVVARGRVFHGGEQQERLGFNQPSSTPTSNRRVVLHASTPLCTPCTQLYCSPQLPDLPLPILIALTRPPRSPSP